MQIALLEKPLDSEAKSVAVTWEELVSALRQVEFTPCAPCKGHECASKKGKAWIPARFTNPRRVDASVAAITFAVFDLDAPTREQLAEVAGALEGFAYFAHETHAGGSFRLVMPLTAEIPAAQWATAWDVIVARFKLPADPTCKNLSHMYFTPTAPIGRESRAFDGVGKALDWALLDPILANGAASAVEIYKSAAVASARALSDPHEADRYRPVGPIDLTELRQATSGMKRAESRQLLDMILAGEPLAVPGKRDPEILRACGLLACAPLGKPYQPETIVKLLEASITAMDTEPEGLQHWLDVARDKYIRKVAERLARDASKDDDREAILRVLGQETGKVVDGTDDAWRKDLSYSLTPAGDPSGIRQTGSNVNLILSNDHRWKNNIRFNELSKDLDLSRSPIAKIHTAVAHTEASNWLARSEYGLAMRSGEVAEQMIAIGRAQGFDPVRDWIDMQVWDGVARVENFFSTHLDAKGPIEHLRAISRCFLISCVARIYQPGCEVHTVPILVGRQGAGKSRSLKALGQPWFMDSPINLADKDSRLAISSSWIVELSELASVRGQAVDKVKAFVSEATDKLRPPYGKVVEDFPRRSVFVGTSNDEEVLTDWTGNRRWWPFHVGNCDVDRVTRDRAQLFAEAAVMYKAGRQWYLNDVESALAEKQTDGFKPSDIRAEQIQAWFVSKAPHERPRELTTFDMLTVVFNIPSGTIQPSGGLAQSAGRAAKSLGFTKHQVILSGSRTWVFRAPKELLEMKRDSKPSVINAVPEQESGT